MIITAQQIIDNINARLALLRSQGFDKGHASTNQLQELLDDICRHNMDISNIDESTQKHNR